LRPARRSSQLDLNCGVVGAGGSALALFLKRPSPKQDFPWLRAGSAPASEEAFKPALQIGLHGTPSVLVDIRHLAVVDLHVVQLVVVSILEPPLRAK
jgi:hypothetical protein